MEKSIWRWSWWGVAVGLLLEIISCSSRTYQTREEYYRAGGYYNWQDGGLKFWIFTLIGVGISLFLAYRKKAEQDIRLFGKVILSSKEREREIRNIRDAREKEEYEKERKRKEKEWEYVENLRKTDTAEYKRYMRISQQIADVESSVAAQYEERREQREFEKTLREIEDSRRRDFEKEKMERLERIENIEKERLAVEKEALLRRKIGLDK